MKPWRKKERETDRVRVLTRRSLMLGAGQLGLFTALVGRMYELQVRDNERYSLLAEENRVNTRLLSPSRGMIVDRYGVPLTANLPSFRVVLVPEQAVDVEAVLDNLARLVPIADRARVLREIGQHRPFVPVTVQENLDWDAVARIEVHTPELPGVAIEAGELRDYPYGAAAAHFVGYVGAVAEADLTGDPVLGLPGFRIGKTGLERARDLALRGTAGESRVEVNAVGRVIRELGRDPGTPGQDVQSTVDIGLQTFVQARLAGELSAAACVLDIATGEVLAMASVPGFDPNLFSRGIDAESWRRLSEDPYAPMTNKVVTGQYAPGSTFKTVVALAALEHGVVGPDHTHNCPGFMTLGNHRFHCWRRGGHGTIGLVQALAQSCDVFFYDLGRRVGIDRIAETGRKLGLGAPLGIDLPQESPGLMPTQEWKQRVLGHGWLPGETVVAAIGQGYVLTTPLQLATMTARMVNGGRAVQPHLTYKIGRPDSPPQAYPAGDLGIAREALDLVVNGMVEVMSGAHGTARAHQIRVPGMQMGGKTGTSQVRRITMAERATGVISNDRLPWAQRDHALFIAFAPVQAPRYATSVVVEHGGGGSAVAAPMAADILLECQRRNPGRRLDAAGQVVAALRPAELAR